MNVTAMEYIFGSIFLMSNKLQVLGDSYLEEITLKQWFLLMMIHNIGREKPSVTDVAFFIGSTRQNVRKMLNVLENKGYVEISVNPKDKRNLTVSLTAQTYQFFADFDERGEAFLQQLFHGINPRLLESTRVSFEEMFTNMEKMEEKNEKDCSHL